MPSSGEVAGHTQLNLLSLTLPIQACMRTYSGHETHEKHKRLLEPVFGLSNLGYCRNMAVEHDGLLKRGSTPSIDIKGSFKVTRIQHFICSGDYTLMKT